MKIVSDDGKREFNSVEEALAWEEALKQLKAREETERKTRDEEEKRKKEELQKEFELLNHEIRAAYMTLNLVLDKVSKYEKKTGKPLQLRYDYADGGYSLFESPFKLRLCYGNTGDFKDTFLSDLVKACRMK